MSKFFGVYFKLFHEIRKLQKNTAKNHMYESFVVKFLQIKVM